MILQYGGIRVDLDLCIVFGYQMGCLPASAIQADLDAYLWHRNTS